MAPDFDYSNGSAVIQNGIIYYSPNCSRPVVIPSHSVYHPDPFRQPRLDASMFKQPVWWSDGWAWLSFVPLAPSFVFTPFEPLCGKPCIEEVTFSYTGQSGEIRRETRFRMKLDEIERWALEEKRIIQVASAIQLRYGISGSLPPVPSSFNYGRAHKTHKVAKRMISLSREWFAIWMGFVSYLIAKTASRIPNGEVDQSSPAPDWYNYLRNEHKFSETWLDGLRLSTVCTFNMGTPRAGIIFQWSEENRHRESIDWFYKHHIPLWFVWSNKEEEAVSNNTSLAYLRPPNEFIQQALTKLFTVPNVPLAGLVIQQFYRLGNDPVTNKTLDFLRLQHAPSTVFEFVTDKFLRQGSLLERTRLEQTQEEIDADLTALEASQVNKHRAAAEAASSFPYVGLHTTRFQAAAEAASSSSEPAWTSPGEAWPSPGDAWTWPSQDTWSFGDAWPSVDIASSSSHNNPLTTKVEGQTTYNHYSDFFEARERRQKEMMKVESPRDRQARESRARNPGVKNAKVYEWEKTQSSGGREVYRRVKVNKKRNEDVYCSYKPRHRLFNAFANEWDFCGEFNFGDKDGNNSDFESDDNDENYPKDFVSQPTSVPQSVASMDVEEHELEDSSATPTDSRDPLKTLSLVYGYVPRSSANDVRLTSNWDAILHYLGFIHDLHQLDVPEPEKTAMMNFFCTVVSQDGANNMDTGFEDLFPFHQVRRLSEDLFVFSSPPSNACHWVLGVHSPAVALYVCRYILENPHAHTILTVAHHLLDKGIRFRTLLDLPCSPRQLTVDESYKPQTYRLINHTFTMADFDVAMMACQSVLTSPQGRAALLRGGIVGRIAKEFLSIDGVLDGPSVEVSAHRVGYIAPSGNDNTRFCDDELTDNEIAIICGTYSLYTTQGQIAVWSWFPPPAAWESNNCGCSWLTWTERSESVFLGIMSNARNGKGKPKSLSVWRDHLRGQRFARTLVKNNESRSKAFMDRVVPFSN